jgi:hypothetical protein
VWLIISVVPRACGDDPCVNSCFDISVFLVLAGMISEPLIARGSEIVITIYTVNKQQLTQFPNL